MHGYILIYEFIAKLGGCLIYGANRLKFANLNTFQGKCVEVLFSIL